MNPEPYDCTAPGCPGRILFPANARTRRPGPVDAEPVPDGNLELDWAAGTYQVLTGATLAVAREQGRPLHVSHYATCTDPPAFRAGLRYRTARPAGTARNGTPAP